VTVLDVLDAAAVGRWSRSAVDRLGKHRAEIDALNVFPVADSDTGRNMLLTLRAAERTLAEANGSDVALEASAALAALWAGASRGAIGNSGFLLSQILRGLAESARRSPRCDATALVAGLDAGARFAREAVVTPVDGTILTVARAAADAAAAADRTVPDVLLAAVSAADVALQHTPEQLPALAEAGVVDAGGRGLVLVLDALAAAVGGAVPALAPVQLPRHAASRASDPAAARFEVQYLLDAPAHEVDRVRATLAELGDSVAVVGAGRDAWKVHAHVDDVGAAIEAGVVAGRPHEISVVPLEPAAPSPIDASAPARLLVAVAPGRGLAQLFEREGVAVVDALPGAVSVDDITAAVPNHVQQIVVLVGPAFPARVADAAAARLRKRQRQVSVVPIRSAVQGLAAIAVHDPTRRFDDDVVTMAEAAAATRFAEVTLADTAALTAVGLCQPGDVLGLIEGDIVQIGHSVLAVTFELLDRLLAVGAELLTLLVGANLPDQAAELFESHVRRRSQFTEVAVYQAGQPDPLLIVGAE
jgi:DAK2 domain fusion protein YloV